MTMRWDRIARRVRPESLEVRRDEFRVLVRRSREVVVLAAITGVVTGLAVRGFEFLVDHLFEIVLDQATWVTATAPALGLVASALILRYAGGGASSATSDEYLRAFHDPAYRLRPRHLVARIAASVATIGSGGALGLEGPSIYGGSAIGSIIQRRLPKPFRGADHRTLLVAGAAAGVAAIFKAPATGAIFALEVPVPRRSRPPDAAAGARRQRGRVPHVRQPQRHRAAAQRQPVRHAELRARRSLRRRRWSGPPARSVRARSPS